MRDVLITLLLFGAIPFILVRPMLGVLLWVLVSVMNPHRLTWGFAYDLPFAYAIAVATLIGLFFTREPKALPVTATSMTLLLLTLWMAPTLLFAIDFQNSLPLWERAMKIFLMTFVALCIVKTRQQIHAFIWVTAGSVAFYGIKGGLFTLRGGGGDRVYGPQSSLIEENNALALAVVMTIPLLQYLRLHSTNIWLRRGLLVGKLLCGFSALGSYSRGAFVAIGAMLGALWVKSRGKIVTGVLLAALAPAAISLMPDRWMARMQTIDDYQEDASVAGRFNAWSMAFNLANDRPLVGGGFYIYTATVFSRYAPDPSKIHAAHSIYFQMLGEHGYVGLGLFLLLWFFSWREAAWIIKTSKNKPELNWASDLAKMIQVSYIGYAVGGAFLNLAYYDVPYFLMVALVATRKLLEKEILQAPVSSAGSSQAAQLTPISAGFSKSSLRSRE